MIDPKTKGDTFKPEEQLVEGTSLWKDAFRRLRKNRAAMAGLLVVMFMAISAIGYPVISSKITRFTLDEQHLFVVPKPPGARSVPSTYYDLMPPEGDFAFDKLDLDGDGYLDQNEIEQ